MEDNIKTLVSEVLGALRIGGDWELVREEEDRGTIRIQMTYKFCKLRVILRAGGYKYHVGLRVNGGGWVSFRKKDIVDASILPIAKQVETWAKNAKRKIDKEDGKKIRAEGTFEMDKSFLEKEIQPLLDKYNFIVAQYEPIFGGIAEATIVYKGHTLYVQRGLEVDVKIGEEKTKVKLGMACQLLNTLYGAKR